MSPPRTFEALAIPSIAQSSEELVVVARFGKDILLRAAYQQILFARVPQDLHHGPIDLQQLAALGQPANTVRGPLDDGTVTLFGKSQGSLRDASLCIVERHTDNSGDFVFWPAKRLDVRLQISSPHLDVER